MSYSQVKLVNIQIEKPQLNGPKRLWSVLKELICSRIVMKKLSVGSISLFFF